MPHATHTYVHTHTGVRVCPDASLLGAHALLHPQTPTAFRHSHLISSINSLLFFSDTIISSFSLCGAAENQFDVPRPPLRVVDALTDVRFARTFFEWRAHTQLVSPISSGDVHNVWSPSATCRRRPRILRLAKLMKGVLIEML